VTFAHAALAPGLDAMTINADPYEVARVEYDEKGAPNYVMRRAVMNPHLQRIVELHQRLVGFAQANVDRCERLRAVNPAYLSDADLDAARGALAREQLELEEAELRLEKGE
jgi:hypothetical protein